MIRRLRFRQRLVLLIGILCSLTTGLYAATEWVSNKIWPEPKIVDPGPPGGPPSDAIVLLDGKNMSAWNHAENWLVQDGSVTIGGSHSIETKQSFGDCQLHVEFATPREVKGEGQGRGNSGIYLLGRYEVQVLDSYDSKTYFDGQCAAIYKQYPPLVNACRKPGEWQTYDIVFESPRFDGAGNLTRPAYVTVLQNGVLVQNHTELEGSTFWEAPPHYTPHPERAPLQLQNHGNPVKFRNIWIRELQPRTYELKVSNR
ncbi:MAG: DUF1080 domain-containing protein [Pirellulales bacterium]|nr:DUF1080 domain-containing protein [Pirellulales bacterium]